MIRTNRWRRVGWRVARVVVLAYLGLCLVLCLEQRRLIYPGAHMPDSPEAPAAGFEPWKLEGKFVGYQRVGGRSGSCLFYLHGNGGTARSWSHAVAAFPGDVFLLEYPGYGERPGAPTEKGLKRAALEAFDTLTNYSQRVVCGQSLGSGVVAAVFSARPERVEHVVLIVPFTSMADVAANQYWFVPARLLLLDRYPVFEAWKQFPGKSTVFLAREDEIIPSAARWPYLRAVSSNHWTIELPEVGHNDIQLNGLAWRRVVQGLEPDPATF